MSSAAKEYKGLRLKIEQIEGCLSAFGVQNLAVNDESAKIKRITGEYEGKDILVRIFQTDKGSTIGFSAGKDRVVFDKIAGEIADKCGYAGKHSLSLSVKNVSVATIEQLEQFLEAEGAVRQFADDENALRIIKRWQGPRHDKLSLTHFKTTGTLLIQGLNAHLASLVLDMLRVLLPEATSLAIDLEAFAIPISIAEAKDHAAARLPSSHDWVSEPVRRQLSSSIALMKTTQILEDYCGIASPAVRGLEGFLKQVYCTKGAIPEEKTNIGEWFERKGAMWAMREIPALHLGPDLATILSDGYSIYHAERHTLSHMGFDPANTRLIENIQDARTIVNRVLDFIEASCAKIRA